MNFQDRVERIPFSGCWIWMGPLSSGGYGRIHIDGKRYAAHRVSYRIANGGNWKLPNVCHRCDVPACINPDHLFLGTQADNIADMRAKGRGTNPPKKSGEAHYAGKLTVEDVIAIRTRRAAGEKVIDLASEFGVSHGLISHIVTRRKWKDVA